MVSKILRSVLLFVIFAMPCALRAQTVEYIHTDALGSVVAITNSAGAVVERNAYEPYGEDLTGIKDGPGYTGHVSDAVTGLNYMQQRYYDPMLGRFLSTDPIAAYTNPTAAFNRYWYANNNPFRFTDSDGRQAKEMGRWIRALWDNNGDFEKAEAQVDRQHEMDRKVVETVVEFTAVSVVKDAVEVSAKVANEKDATGQGVGAVAGEVAGQMTEKVLDGKISSGAASVVGAAVGKAVGDAVEAGVNNARQPAASPSTPPPPPLNPEVRNKVGDK